MIKNFNELSKVEVPITKKPTFKFDKARQKMIQVGELDTLSWADCLSILYQQGAEKVTFENIPNGDGLLYIDKNGAATIRIYVDIDGERRDIFYPVIDGTKDIKLEEIKQSDIYNAKQRAFVKCVAVNWGLGISLWKREIEPDSIQPEEKESWAEQFRAIVNTSVKKCGGITQMLDHLTNVSEKDIKRFITDLQTIDGITTVLGKVLNNDKE